ncbi:MAG: MoxR family ATPase [Candidatus Thermoplasmatota archaeon]|nr:MoxR family ATPase [Candidatus Thermoplasmatota archaeon]
MSKLTPKRQAFIDAAISAGYSSPLNRADVVQIVDDFGDSHGFSWPSWITADQNRRLDRGVFDVPELNGGEMAVPAKAAEVIPDVVAQVSQAPSAPVIKQVSTAPSTTFDLTAGSYVPDRLGTYVPWGHFKDVEAIVKSGIFAPVFITGLPGNGKTVLVEQICARHKREFFRVNITAMTDEEDLIGGFRLVEGETVWQDGPVVHAMRRGGVLLLDEIDQGTPKMMCLQPVLEGKPIFIKKINQWVEPAKGFTVLSTANTKGQGDMDGRFAGAQVLNGAFLDRQAFTFEQGYPTVATEKKIVKKNMDVLGCRDDDFADLLCRWADIIRQSFYEGSVDEVVTTRRLIDAVSAFAIFGDRLKAIDLIIARFDDDTKTAFHSLYTKVDGDVDDVATSDSGALSNDTKCPF